MNCYTKRVDRSFQGLLLSLCVHAFLIWLLLKAEAPPIQPSEAPTEITILDGKNEKSKTFVTETEAQEVYQKLKDQADYLSQFTKRVKRQLKAKVNDRTQNLNLNPVTQPMPIREGMTGNQKSRESGELSPDSRPTDQPAMRNVVIGASSIAEHIPGVEEGAFTALNTDQFTYYAFFARINEQIRNRWISGVRAYVGRLNPKEHEILSKYDRQTIIEIVLTQEGRFLGSTLYQSSGDRRLDQTTVEAFRAAAPFLNPPQGLIESDGHIRLKYGFVVRFRPPNFGPGRQ